MSHARHILMPFLGSLAVTLLAGDLSKPVPAAPAASPAPLTAPVKGATVEGITEYRIANGLRVLLLPDVSKPAVTVNITYLVGSRHENYGETGMAHLLEHMLFKGTPRHPNVPQLLNELGGRFNGTTWLDRTNYYATFPASEANLVKVLELEADRMVNSNFGAEALWGKDGRSGEMTVVRNEFETGQNNPLSVTLERIQAVAFDWHNYGKATIGARTDIEQVNVEHLRAFYRKYYQPDNAVLVVAGQFDPTHTLDLVNRIFGAIPRPTDRKLEATYTLDPVQDGERSVTIRRVGGTPIVAVGYHVAPGFTRDRAQLELAASMLTEAPSGRLHKALVETKLAAGVLVNIDPTFEPGFMVFAAQLPKDGDVEKVKQVLIEQVEGLKAHPFTADELSRARVKARKDLDLLFSDTHSVAVALSDAAGNGDWRSIFLNRDWTLDAKLEEIQSAAVNALKTSNRTLAVYQPTEAPERTTPVAMPDVAAQVKDYAGHQALAQGEAFDATPEAVEARTLRFTAPNGLRGALLSRKTKGAMATGLLTLRFGREADLMNRGAVPSLVSGMLTRGTLKHNRQELAEVFDRLRAKVTVTGGANGATLRLTAPRETFLEALRLAAEVLKEPAFPSSEMEPLRKELETSIEGQRNEPQAKVVDYLGAAFNAYPAGHPAAFRSTKVRLADLHAAKIEDLKAFHKGFYGADHAEFTASGDFDTEAVQREVTALFGNWRSKAPYERVVGRQKAPHGERKSIETPDKQGAFFLAQSGWSMKDTDADFPAFFMANQILGGGMLKSRLADRLRQQEGFSYGAGSTFAADSLDALATWKAWAIYAPANGDKLVAAFDEEIQKALKDGFTQVELDFARTAWLQAEYNNRQEDGAIAAWLGRGLYLNRPLAFQSDMEKKMKALKLEEVNAALRKYLRPETFVLVKAGDFPKGINGSSLPTR
ncbi:MAG TPA: pitrilysin family protein [Holophagaceae bacterium]|nr:pitrilysin family protein [Holophagaceae bacterium]